jgi:hypothetical protein
MSTFIDERIKNTHDPLGILELAVHDGFDIPSYTNVSLSEYFGAVGEKIQSFGCVSNEKDNFEEFRITRQEKKFKEQYPNWRPQLLCVNLPDESTDNTQQTNHHGEEKKNEESHFLRCETNNDEESQSQVIDLTLQEVIDLTLEEEESISPIHKDLFLEESKKEIKNTKKESSLKKEVLSKKGASETEHVQPSLNLVVQNRKRVKLSKPSLIEKKEDSKSGRPILSEEEIRNLTQAQFKAYHSSNDSTFYYRISKGSRTIGKSSKDQEEFIKNLCKSKDHHDATFFSGLSQNNNLFSDKCGYQIQGLYKKFLPIENPTKYEEIQEKKKRKQRQ